jgi:hypothetical protein
MIIDMTRPTFTTAGRAHSTELGTKNVTNRGFMGLGKTARDSVVTYD